MTRRAVNRLWAETVIDDLRASLPKYSVCHLDDALRGDPDAAARLVVSAPNSRRGRIALAAYWAGLPNPAYRRLLGMAWEHDHAHVIAASETRARLVRMFRAAHFDHPFAEPLKVYRGGCGERRLVAAGFSWTVDRDVACWFAQRIGVPPVVVSAQVQPANVIYWSNERNESEVVLDHVPIARLDTARQEDWQQGALRFSERIRTSEAAILSGPGGGAA